MINDFIEYWAAAKLLIAGGNPYSPEPLLLLQQSAGWSPSVPLIMCGNLPGRLLRLLACSTIGLPNFSGHALQPDYFRGRAHTLTKLRWRAAKIYSSIYSQYRALVNSADVIQPFDWATPSLGSAMARAVSDRPLGIDGHRQFRLDLRSDRVVARTDSRRSVDVTERNSSYATIDSCCTSVYEWRIDITKGFCAERFLILLDGAD
ncbi:MAG: hypothetical protein ACREQO_20355 [Candidatus Binatia bacterium]